MKSIVQCITNNVTINDCANAVLAVGASPIMAHHISEVEEVQSFSKALLLNLGATDDYDAMKVALMAASNLGHPVVLDPVGVSGISFRRKFALELLSQKGITCIRGNYNEIRAIMENQAIAAGLDYDKNNNGTNSISMLADCMKQYARENHIILAASGETDIVTDGNEVAYIESGDAMMSSITGSGCMASAVIASMLARDNSMKSVVSAMKEYGDCGSRAADLTRKEGRGIGMFHQLFLDELSLANWDK